MKFYSTNRISPPVSIKEAVMKGLADDKGLYMPERIPLLPKTFFDSISTKTFQEISFEVASAFLENDIPEESLKKIIDEAINFDAPLVSLDDNINALELFHGPTSAFKDFGARFMAGLVSFFMNGENSSSVRSSSSKTNESATATATATILVATSGDTGSAVASGFYEVPGINVFILYPSGKVSEIQEKQLTTWGKNIIALEVNGTFDDCQRMVKEAFGDSDINKKMMLTSANSINIARLIPQSFYYFNAYAQLKDKNRALIISVPSGNFGNLTAGLIAMRMGLPVTKFIASTNINNAVPLYLKNGVFKPHASYATISNAMDVGNPSNFARMYEMMPSVDEMGTFIKGCFFSDDETRAAMKEVYGKLNYTMDPHGAVGYLGLAQFLTTSKMNKLNGIFLETAHPAKFSEVVESTIDAKIPIPVNLQKFIEKDKRTTLLSNKFLDLKEFLMNL